MGQLIKLITNIDHGFDDKWVPVEPVNEIRDGIRVARAPNGTQSGKSSVILFAPLPQGGTVALEITMANFEVIAAAFRGAEERDEQNPSRN